MKTGKHQQIFYAFIKLKFFDNQASLFIVYIWVMFMENITRGAYAKIKGGKEYPDISGEVYFDTDEKGVIVTATVSGLPRKNPLCAGIFAFHIHAGNACTGDSENEFKNAGGHYNPSNLRHPCHAGDLPPLFSNDGSAYMQVLTDRFGINEIIGKTVIIHMDVDDFTSQPSGNAGKMIACGVIEAR